MKVFTKKGIIQKIIVLIIFVMLFNFIVPNISLAIGEKKDNASEIFGRLFTPIKELLLGVTDAVIWGLQYVMYGMPETFVDAYWQMNINIDLSGNVNDIPRNSSQAIDQAKSSSKGIIPVNLRLPMFVISPEEIFSNEIPLLDVDFFNIDGDGSKQIQLENGETVTVDSSAAKLQPMISKWYYALRNFAIVALLSILVYIAIRIIISSTSESKAKYKSRLMDWLVAMCLLFTMHYIMSFAVTLNNEIVRAVGSMSEPYNYPIKAEDGDDRLPGSYKSNDMQLDTSGGAINWTTNLMGRARIDLQLMSKDYSATQKLLHNFAYIVIYMGLVMYTVLFLFRYFKRVIILAFLTIVAPLVAMTYPLDKIQDGKAEGFNKWIKEYIFNLLIQPVHLILYTVLIGTAIDFAADNLLYSLVAFGFILQAEKLMMKFFGFNKASTVSNTSAALGGALAMKGLNSLTKRIGSSNKQPKGEKQAEKEKSTKITQANRKPDRDINELMNSVFGGARLSLGGGGNWQTQPNPTQNTNPTGDNTPTSGENPVGPNMPTPNSNPAGTDMPMPNTNPLGTDMSMPNINPEVPNFPAPNNNSEQEDTTQTDTDNEVQNPPIANNNPRRNMEGGNNSDNAPDYNPQNYDYTSEDYNEDDIDNPQNNIANINIEETQSNNENNQIDYENSSDNSGRQRNSNNTNNDNYSNRYQPEIETDENSPRLSNRGPDLSSLFDDLPKEEKRTLTMPQRAWKRNKICRTKGYRRRSKGCTKSRISSNWCNNRLNCRSCV